MSEGVVVLVAHEQMVDRPFAEVAARLDEIFPTLDRMASGAFTNERLADIRIGPGTHRGEPRFAKHARLRWSAPIVDEERWMVSLGWSTAHASIIFPRMEADLTATSVGDSTLIRFRGNYQPPLGPVGEALDRAAFHLVAEGTVENFVERVIEQLEDTPDWADER